MKDDYLEDGPARDRLFDELVNAALPFAIHDWMDAELEDDNCKLANGSGPITVGDWRRLRAVLSKIQPSPMLPT